MMIHKRLFALNFLLLIYYFSSAGNEFRVFFTEYNLLPSMDTSLSKINIYFYENNRDSILTDVIRYDVQGRVNSYIKMDMSGKTVHEKKDIAYYDQTDLIAKTTKYNYLVKSSKPLIDAYDYDSLGRKSFHYSFDVDTTNVEIEQFVYNGNLLSKVLQKIDRVPDFFTRDILFYDKLNRLIKKDRYNMSKQIVYSEVYEYDGNQRASFLINASGKTLKYIDEFNGRTLMKHKDFGSDEIIDGPSGTLYTKDFDYEITYKYENNHVTELTLTRQDGSVARIKLFYVLKK